VRPQIPQAQNHLEKAPMKMQAIRNDFLIDKDSLKFVRIDGNCYTLEFNFESKADTCNVSLHQQVMEHLSKEGETVLAVDLIPQDIQPIEASYDMGKHRFSASVNFDQYSRQQMVCKPREGYWPIVINARSWYHNMPDLKYS
jgi:hypothetical protein